MEFASWSIVLAMASLAILFFFSKHRPFRFHKLKLPPGPKPWPIVGNLNLLGPLPHQSLHKLSQKYGPLMHLKFGSLPVVVVSSPEMTKSFLQTYDHIFASRPQTAAGKYTSYNNTNILWAPWGPYLRQVRKICLSELFTSRRLESYEYIRVEERRALFARLYALAGKPIKVKEHLLHLSLSVISKIVLGDKYFSATKSETSIVSLREFQEMLEEWFLVTGAFNIGDWIPWLDFLDLQGYVKRMKTLMKKFDRFHDHIIDLHNAKREEKDFIPKDMVDLLLQLVDDPNIDVKLTVDNVKGLIQDLIVGGTDSTVTTMEWAIFELLKQPHLIKKAIKDLDRVVGKDRWVEEKDIPQIPYIDAIIKETMRKHPATPLLAPHLSLEDCNIEGYDICKRTTVFINTWSMGRDPLIWDAPEEFRPERFLEKAIDVKGQHFELLPFGSGRRMCPGYTLALKMISTTLANLLHGFEWNLPDKMAPEDLSMEEFYCLTLHKKAPLVAVLKPRLPLHLY